MHLLQRKGDGTFQRVEFLDQIPRYAILSHTWGADKDEVTFDDITKGTGTSKVGYRKLHFCAEQATLDGLNFFWIDTCCINKDSSTELQEAIISMFKWYRDSAKCYVYLADVSTENGMAFQHSRWFRRGWTLQELVAPKCVEFYSTEGKSLGSKSSRAQEIAQITRIPIEALQLQERALSHFSVDERMHWVQGRETKRGEDMAYSLMGIFDIEMTLLYGEGREKAVERLRRKIRRLQEDSRGPRVEEVVLQRDYFRFVLQTPTMLHEAGDHFSLLMGDSRKTGRPDLIAVSETGTSDENIEVNLLYGAHNYQNFLLRIATPNFTPLLNWTKQLNFALTDWSGDGTLDLVVIKKSHTATNTTEVHIFSGSSNFQQILLQKGTKLEQTDNTWSFGMGKWAAGQKPDLFAIKNSSPPELYILRGDDTFQSIILHTQLGLHTTNTDFDFLVADWNRDGRPDIVAVKKSETNSRCAEVHVLSGASLYKDFILRAQTPLFRNNGLYEFAVADWTGDGRPDLVAFKKTATGTNTTEVHVMSPRE